MILYRYSIYMFTNLICEILLFNDVLLFKNKLEEGAIIQCDGRVDQGFDFKQLRGMKKIENCENIRIKTVSGTELEYTFINESWPAHFEEGILLIKSPTDFDLGLQTTATCYSDNGVNKYQFNGMNKGMLNFNCNFNTLTDTISGAPK